MSGRNNLQLAIKTGDTYQITHFNLKEFENPNGWAMVHESVIISLTKVRKALMEKIGEEVEIIITGSTRTPQDLKRLAERLGWLEEGGSVARNSRHLDRFGGIAVDFYARQKRDKKRIATNIVKEVSQQYFDFVKADYPDGHIHADNRNQSNTTL